MNIPTLSLPIAILAAIAMFAGNASADTMYKCTAPNGKVSFSDQPCAGNSKTATLDVIAPQNKKTVPSEVWQQREKPESEMERLRRADAAFRDRLAASERADASARLSAAKNRTYRLEAEERKRQQQAAEDAEDARQAAIAANNRRDR